MLTRRDFISNGLVGAAGVALLRKPTKADDKGAPGEIALILASHWSYIGIGWQLGIESCVVSVIDAVGMADHAPGVRTCLELDAHTWEVMAKYYPEATDKLKTYLKAGKVELVGGAFSQPLAVMFSGESNLRNIVVGRQAIHKTLGYEVKTFLEEESFSFPQLPQILAGADYEYASIAQVDTWGRAGVPYLDLNAFNWKGKDGTTIPTTPKNPLFMKGVSMEGVPPGFAALPALKELEGKGKALVVDWEEFGWDPADNPAYKSDTKKYQKLSEQLQVEYLTLTEYMRKYGKDPKKTIYLDMDKWTKLLPWGIGGDQLRTLNRKVESLLLAADELEVIARHTGSQSRKAELDQAWRNMLTAQTHDAALCEYSIWQGNRMAPLDRVKDQHNFPWGNIGYNHLGTAQEQGEEVLNACLGEVAGRIGSASGKQGDLAVVVFNPFAWKRTGIATTGRVNLKGYHGKNVTVRDATGRALPSQMIASDTIPPAWERDAQGELLVGNVAFVADDVPSVGYNTYYLDFSPVPAETGQTDLKVSRDRFEMENEHLRIKLSPVHGNVVSLVDKKTGRDLIDGAKSPFPVFRGRANPRFPAPRGYGNQHPSPSTIGHLMFESAWTKPKLVQWTETGPIRATLRTRFEWPLLVFETDVRLCARTPWVEVVSRILAKVPPAVDETVNGRMPVDVKEGYWIDFAPNLNPTRILRDYAYAIEPTTKSAFGALTLMDLEDTEGGLLVLHSGTQYFRKDYVSEGVFSNLLVREWESFFSNRFGWPRYSQYRHALMPHGVSFSNGRRLRASKEFTQDLLTVVTTPAAGKLNRRKSFVSLEPENVQLSSYRTNDSGQTELRVVNFDDQTADVRVASALPVKSVTETNLLGRKIKDMQVQGNSLGFDLKPWGFRTFELA